MSQDISQISLNGPQQIATSKKSTPPAPQQQETTIPATDGTAVKTKSDTVLISAAKSVQGGRFQQLEDGLSDRRNAAALIRQTDTKLEAIISQVEAMKANLAKIVKNYPPFSIDSKERMEILRSFISLRKEIDSMTIPAPPPQPGVQMKSEIWQDKGLSGLLPGQLAIDAPDDQVQSAYDQLAGAVQSIGEGRKELQSTYTS